MNRGVFKHLQSKTKRHGSTIVPGQHILVSSRAFDKAARLNYSGQMTVEFVIAFPVLLIVALTAVNAVLFFSECASFDRSFRSSVCAFAASPAYEQDVGQSCAQVAEALRSEFSAENLQVQVTSSGTAGGLVEFRGTLTFQPTLFGKGSLSGVFGVSFPALTHEESMVVDVYKPGVFV